MKINEQLLSALLAALEWIDAVPSDTVLPAMPGFDRDEVNEQTLAKSCKQRRTKQGRWSSHSRTGYLYLLCIRQRETAQHLKSNFLNPEHFSICVRGST
ncbi:TPA: hypothetical protein ACNMRY_005322 [Klebsiella pneumoniae]